MTEDQMMEQIDRLRQLGKEIGIENTVWSVDKHNHDLFMDTVAFDHRYVFFVYADGWDDVKPLFSEGYTRPTWRDVWLAADDLVRRSNDKHHIFLESARVVDEVNGALIVKVDFGS